MVPLGTVPARVVALAPVVLELDDTALDPGCPCPASVRGAVCAGAVVYVGTVCVGAVCVGGSVCVVVVGVAGVTGVAGFVWVAVVVFIAGRVLVVV